MTSPFPGIGDFSRDEEGGGRRKGRERERDETDKEKHLSLLLLLLLLWLRRVGGSRKREKHGGRGGPNNTPYLLRLCRRRRRRWSGAPGGSPFATKQGERERDFCARVWPPLLLLPILGSHADDSWGWTLSLSALLGSCNFTVSLEGVREELLLRVCVAQAWPRRRRRT